MRIVICRLTTYVPMKIYFLILLNEVGDLLCIRTGSTTEGYGHERFLSIGDQVIDNFEQARTEVMFE